MINIAIKTTTVYSVELTDQDVGHILVDPSDFQRRLRALRQGEAKAKAQRTGLDRRAIKFGKPRRDPKGSTPSGRATPSTNARTPCKLCGKPLKPNGVTRHMRQSHPDSAAAATA